MGSRDTGISQKQFPLGTPLGPREAGPSFSAQPQRSVYIIPISIPTLSGFLWTPIVPCGRVTAAEEERVGDGTLSLKCLHVICQNQSDDPAQAPRERGSLVLPSAHKGEKSWKCIRTNKAHHNSELGPLPALFLQSVQPNLYIILQKARQLLAEEKFTDYSEDNLGATSIYLSFFLNKLL